MTFRLVDATTHTYFHNALSNHDNAEGIPWRNWLEGGDGEGAYFEREHDTRPERSSGDGTHGTHDGNGLATMGEYHVFGGSYMMLLLLEAWRHL